MHFLSIIYLVQTIKSSYNFCFANSIYTNMNKVTLKYQTKCEEIFEDFPGIVSYTIFANGTIVLSNESEENIEIKSQELLKTSWTNIKSKWQIGILRLQDDTTIIAWSEYLLTLILSHHRISKNEQVRLLY